MYELTNEQRACFGLLPVEEGWTPMVLKPSPYHSHTTVAYRDGQTLRKFIASGPDRYTETELNERLSEDGKYLLPKTGRGKPVLLTAASLEKRGGIGMCLRFDARNDWVALHSQTSEKGWYDSQYEPLGLRTIDDLAAWVENWCAETTPADLDAVARFALEPRQHVKFREGDVFRFKITRRLYGYGRVLMDYAKLRKEKVPFWDILFGKPTACAVYHIATERDDVTPEELEKLPSLPSVHMMDNRLYYGDFVIIGNLPLRQREDWPIMYGRGDWRGQTVHLQCGRRFLRLEDAEPLFQHDPFQNGGIGFGLRFSLPVLLRCIREGSNDPYWEHHRNPHRRDLRDPQYRPELELVCRQFGIAPEELV